LKLAKAKFDLVVLDLMNAYVAKLGMSYHARLGLPHSTKAELPADRQNGKFIEKIFCEPIWIWRK
jgi:hypothetical protein